MESLDQTTAYGKQNNAFTLNELLISIAILSTLALISYPCLQHALIRANLSTVFMKSKTISYEYMRFYADHQIYPEDIRYDSSKGKDVSISLRNDCQARYFFRYSFGLNMTQNAFIDPFIDYYEGTTCFESIRKSELFSLIRNKQIKTPGCILVSRGPDQLLEPPKSTIVYQGMIYDSSNGLHSVGDILIEIPGNSSLNSIQ